MDPLSNKTIELFKKNRLAGYFNYVRPGEVVPHFFSRGSYFLSRDEETHQLVGTVNSCLHRGFKLVNQRMKRQMDQSIGCKFHNWTYDKNGMLLTTPGFDREVKGCLSKVDLTDVGEGFFFETASMRSISMIKNVFTNFVIDLDYVFDQENVTFYPCNWMTFMEVYLGMYHHKTSHPNGLGKFLIDEITYVSNEDCIVCAASIAPEDVVISSFGWSKFNEELRKIGWTKKWGAIFCAIFPGLMIEIFPYTMVISQLVPISDKMTANYLQIYYDSTVRENYDFRNAFGDAYSETAQGDGALQELLEDGRTGNWYEITSLPKHGVLEKGISHLESWISCNTPKEFK